MQGKGVGRVVERARRLGRRVIVIAGSTEGNRAEWERRLGATVVTLDGRRAEAASNLTRAVASVLDAASL
jgi:hypothetical protein